MAWLGPLISAGASVLGGLIGKSSADKATSATQASAAANMAMQREFAQHGIRWRVEDAKAAGIHPLYALGAQVTPFSPQAVHFGGDTSMANAVAAAGQDIGRAVDATRTVGERIEDRVNRAMQAQQLKRMVLENRALELDIQRATNPPFPSQFAPMILDGQGDSLPTARDPFLSGGGSSGGRVVDKALERIAPDPANPSVEPGAHVESSFSRTKDGYAIVPSMDAKQRMEDMLIPELLWAYRNLVGPLFGQGNVPYPAPPGKQWHYYPFSGEMKLRDKRRYKKTPWEVFQSR